MMNTVSTSLECYLLLAKRLEMQGDIGTMVTASEQLCAFKPKVSETKRTKLGAASRGLYLSSNASDTLRGNLRRPIATSWTMRYLA